MPSKIKWFVNKFLLNLCKLYIFTEFCERKENCFLYRDVRYTSRRWFGLIWIWIVACKAVEVTDPKKIPDARMTASTVYGSGYQPYYGRVNTKRGSRWCPTSTTDRTDYLQVDMGAVHSVCAVATQTLNSGEYTKTYYLRLSVDGLTWNTYEENKAKKVNYN